MPGQIDISAESIRSSLELPPELVEPYKVAVEAGLRLLFSENVVDATIEFVTSADGKPMPEKIAEGIFGIVSTVYDGSNGTMPPQLLIPTGIELIGHCADWARESGIVQVTPEEAAEGMSLFVERVLEAAGADPEKLQAVLNAPDSGAELPPEAQGAAPGAVPPAPPAPGMAPQGGF